MRKNSPIGVFDSGVGGISICHAMREQLPNESFIYFADIKYAPYGTKPIEVIDERAQYVTDFLIKKGCKAIVVACNTATVNSIKSLRSKFSIPIVGVEPGIKPAAMESHSGVIGVLATERTLSSDSFKSLKSKFSNKVKIETQACPEFVNLVESLNYRGDRAIKVAEGYIKPFLGKGVDQVILGCTHFSFLTKAIEECLKGKADIVDTAMPVATELKRRLVELNLENKEGEAGSEEFWSSSVCSQVKTKVSELWGSHSMVHEAKP